MSTVDVVAQAEVEKAVESYLPLMRQQVTMLAERLQDAGLGVEGVVIDRGPWESKVSAVITQNGRVPEIEFGIMAYPGWNYEGQEPASLNWAIFAVAANSPQIAFEIIGECAAGTFVPVADGDALFRRWCRTVGLIHERGVYNLIMKRIEVSR